MLRFTLRRADNGGMNVSRTRSSRRQHFRRVTRARATAVLATGALGLAAAGCGGSAPVDHGVARLHPLCCFPSIARAPDRSHVREQAEPQNRRDACSPFPMVGGSSVRRRRSHARLRALTRWCMPARAGCCRPTRKRLRSRPERDSMTSAAGFLVPERSIIRPAERGPECCLSRIAAAGGVAEFPAARR